MHLPITGTDRALGVRALLVAGIPSTAALVGPLYLRPSASAVVIVVVYHVTIVAIGHRMFKEIWPISRGCVLCTAGSSLI